MPTFIELERASDHHDTHDATFGEDDGLSPAPVLTPVYISVNPVYVAALFADERAGVSIVKFSDGRGFKVKGTYSEVKEKLLATPTVN